MFEGFCVSACVCVRISHDFVCVLCVCVCVFSNSFPLGISSLENLHKNIIDRKLLIGLGTTFPNYFCNHRNYIIYMYISLKFIDVIFHLYTNFIFDEKSILLYFYMFFKTYEIRINVQMKKCCSRKMFHF